MEPDEEEPHIDQDDGESAQNAGAFDEECAPNQMSVS